MAKYYKTKITIEVLSDRPYTKVSLNQVAADIVNDCSGKIEFNPSQEIDKPTLRRLCHEHVIDPEFFLDKNDDLTEIADFLVAQIDSIQLHTGLSEEEVKQKIATIKEIIKS